MYKYIHSGEIEDLNDVVPYEDFTDYTAEDFIQDHAIVTDGDEKDKLADPTQSEYDEDEDDVEPRSKRFRGDYDSYDEGSNDYDSRYNNNAPGIPSLLNLNLAPPRHGQDVESAKSPTAVASWEASNQNNKPAGNKDRREGRQRGSRWSSSSRR